MFNKTNIVSAIGVIATAVMLYLGYISIPVAVFAVLYFALEVAKRDTNRKLIDKKIVTTSDKHKLAHLL